jgi:hypothetical protein
MSSVRNKDSTCNYWLILKLRKKEMVKEDEDDDEEKKSNILFIKILWIITNL